MNETWESGPTWPRVKTLQIRSKADAMVELRAVQAVEEPGAIFMSSQVDVSL